MRRVDERDVAKALGLVLGERPREALGSHRPFGLRELDNQSGHEGVPVAADQDVGRTGERALREDHSEGQRERREDGHRDGALGDPPGHALESSLAHLPQALGRGYRERAG